MYKVNSDNPENNIFFKETPNQIIRIVINTQFNEVNISMGLKVENPVLVAELKRADECTLAEWLGAWDVINSYK